MDYSVSTMSNTKFEYGKMQIIIAKKIDLCTRKGPLEIEGTFKHN